MTFEAMGTRTRMTAVIRFVELAPMEAMLGMGMAERMAQAVGRIDALVGVGRAGAPSTSQC